MSLPQKDYKFYEDSKYVKIIDIREDLCMTNREFGNKIWDRALLNYLTITLIDYDSQSMSHSAEL